MDIETAVQLFKMLSNPTRVKLLKILSEKECDYRVSDLEHILEIPQPSVSQHLGHLRNSGLIKFEKQGKTICYKVVNKAVATIIANIQFSEKELENMTGVKKRIFT